MGPNVKSVQLQKKKNCKFSAHLLFLLPGKKFLCNNPTSSKHKYVIELVAELAIVSHLPGGHLPPPKFGHLPPQNSDIYHPKIRTFPTPQKKHLPGGQLPPPIFFLLFLAHFSWLFRLTAHGGHQGWEGGGA